MEISGKQIGIDLFFLILCLRVIYSAISKGVLSEILKIAGLIVGSFAAFQYYSFLAVKAADKVLILKGTRLEFISFFLIFFGVKFIFATLRLVTVSLIKREQIPVIEQRLLFFTGIFRGVFLSSVIIFLLQLSPLNPRHFNSAIAYKAFKNIAPKFYLVSFNFYNNLNPKSSLNKEVREYYESR